MARRKRKRATITRADAEAIQIKGPQRDEKNNNKENGCRGLYRPRARRGKRRAPIKRADAEATQTKGPQLADQGDQRPAAGREGRQ